MEDELINFETAKLAKEKGFCSNVATYFRNKHEDKSTSSLENFNHWFDSENTKYYSRPTQSLLKKWLREVHNIHIDVKIDIVISHKGEMIYGKRVFKYPIKTTSLPLFFYHWSTYEKALEAGLQEALKLI